MAYMLDGRAILGSLQTGKTGLMGYRLQNTSGGLVSPFTTTDVVETGVPGNYRVNGGISIPDGFRGAIVWGLAATDLAEVAINPQEAENADVKTSTVIADPVVIAGDVWDAMAGSHTTAGTFGKLVGDGLAGGTVRLSSNALDAVIVELGLNARQALAIVGAALAGQLSGGGTNRLFFKAMGDPSKLRIDATVDNRSNRVTIVLTPPA